MLLLQNGAEQAGFCVQKKFWLQPLVILILVL